MIGVLGLAADCPEHDRKPRLSTSGRYWVPRVEGSSDERTLSHNDDEYTVVRSNEEGLSGPHRRSVFTRSAALRKPGLSF